jgi:hypothetical protein
MLYWIISYRYDDYQQIFFQKTLLNFVAGYWIPSLNLTVLNIGRNSIKFIFSGKTLLLTNNFALRLMDKLTPYYNTPKI